MRELSLILTLLALCEPTASIRGTKTVDEPQNSYVEERKINLESPEDIGRAHYAVIDSLGSVFEAKHKRKLQMMDDMSLSEPSYDEEFIFDVLHDELTQSFCDEGDFECVNSVYERINKGRELVQDFHAFVEDHEENGNNEEDPQYSFIRSLMPETLDKEVERSLKNTMSIVRSVENIKNMDAREIISSLNEELEGLKQNTEVVNDLHRDIAISGISVAIESTKQWVEVAQDPDHIFFKLRKSLHENRKLQVTSVADMGYPYNQFTDTETDLIDLSEANVVYIIGRDIAGTIAGALDKFWIGFRRNRRVLKSGKGGGGGGYSGALFDFGGCYFDGSSILGIITSFVAFIASEVKDNETVLNDPAVTPIFGVEFPTPA